MSMSGDGKSRLQEVKSYITEVQYGQKKKKENKASRTRVTNRAGLKNKDLTQSHQAGVATSLRTGRQ